MTEKEKMTAPIASVGADVEQPSSNKLTNQSIADLPGKGNLQATNNAENTAKSANKKNPDDLETVSMMELYDTAYPPKLPIVDGLLYNGTYLFVGSPKIGKSFFMAQIGYHISKGLPLWGFSVRQGTVLYLALEDDYARLQKRLSQMFGMEGSENFYFATKSKSLNAGLEQQLVQFVTNHKDARLIIIDTLQKVREVGGDKFSYASDYEIVTKLKAFSDHYGICFLVVHHTRKMESSDSFDMISGTMESFCTMYEEDVRPSLKQSTWLTKENIIQKKILPYLGKRKVSEITAKDVMDWHNQMRKLKTKTGKPLSPTYLKTIHGQLSTIFNHAVKYYDLSTNPARKAGALGEEEGKEMLFWTKEEYKRFAEEMMDKPLSYYAFQLLYWCGIRSGELLALTPADFNFKKKTLRINKSYQRLKGEDVISTPKTKNSVRTVVMPQFLCDEMQDCLKLYYSLKPDDRIFPVTKYYLNHEMERGCKASGVKKIRVHDLRHSHVSLLINMGYTALAIGKRVGHSAEKITYRYAHLFPSVQQDMAEQLDAENVEEELNEVEGGLANVG